ncbi:MAG: ferredoxin [Candidatus Goldiibacteriota bacterium]
MKAKVDKDVCQGAGECQSMCPEVFKVVDGKSVVLTEVVPEGSEEAAKKAESACPTGAVKLS